MKSEQAYRSVFALIGLAVGMVIMFAFGFGGLVPGFIFGAGGSVAGGMIGERMARKRGLR